jgi:hypothetical protein
MIHHSCDRCHRLIDSDNEIRYVLSVEIKAAIEPGYELTTTGEHLEELGDLLEQLGERDCNEIRDAVYQSHRYDLCSNCRREYLENPLAIDRQVEFGCSNN